MKIKNIAKIGDYFYYRAKVRGRSHYRVLPDPQDRRFERKYEEAKREIERLRSGMTFDVLIKEYRRSPYFMQLAPATRRGKEIYFELFTKRFQGLNVSDLTRFDVYEMQNDLCERPGTANNAVAQLGVLLNFAMERGFVGENVAAGVKRLKAGSHLAWPQSVINKVMAHASPMLRLAIATGLESGQRIGDCLRITHEQLEGDLLELEQQKTGKTVFVPVSPKWRQEMAEVPARAKTLLYNRYGKPFRTPDTLQAELRVIMKMIGCPQYTFHGLRKNTTNRLAEMGLSAFEIGAITGMSLPTVVHYTRGVSNRNLAASAAVRLSN